MNHNSKHRPSISDVADGLHRLKAHSQEFSLPYEDMPHNKFIDEYLDREHLRIKILAGGANYWDLVQHGDILFGIRQVGKFRYGKCEEGLDLIVATYVSDPRENELTLALTYWPKELEPNIAASDNWNDVTMFLYVLDIKAKRVKHDFNSLTGTLNDFYYPSDDRNISSIYIDKIHTLSAFRSFLDGVPMSVTDVVSEAVISFYFPPNSWNLVSSGRRAKVSGMPEHHAKLLMPDGVLLVARASLKKKFFLQHESLDVLEIYPEIDKSDQHYSMVRGQDVIVRHTPHFDGISEIRFSDLEISRPTILEGTEYENVRILFSKYVDWTNFTSGKGSPLSDPW